MGYFKCWQSRGLQLLAWFRAHQLTHAEREPLVRSPPKSLSGCETAPIAWPVLLLWLSWGDHSEALPMITGEGTLGPCVLFCPGDI